MAESLYFYKLVSPYYDSTGQPQDHTLNCRLSVGQIDSNFLTLKDYDIKSADFIRDEKILVLTRNNGDKLIVDLSGMVYDLEANANCTESGVTLTMHYDGKDGEKDVRVDNLITLDMLRNKIEELIGTDILTKVITDGTLKGYGTLDSPLGLNGTEKTGMYAPVISRVDLTNGEKLPEVAKLGTRYATVEYVNDYGFLYNEAGMNKIQEHVTEEGRGWRVPSKADWDMLLNLIEPCEGRNHNSAKCHAELGLVAGKYLKSACGWLGQPECMCSPTVPLTGCTVDNGATPVASGDTFDGNSEYVDGTDDYGIPQVDMDSPSGVDKYGMEILPTGVATLDAYGRPQANSYGEKAVLWSTSHVYGDVDQDIYVKVFQFDKAGVIQEAECPSPYYGVRLVKDYDGSNYFDTEYIDGVPYKTILFPEIRQIWLASNYAKKEGFIQYGDEGTPEVAEVNNGEVLEKRKAVFLNEWNGCYWEKKELKEGDTVVVENPCMSSSDGPESTTVTWKDTEGTEHCVVVELPRVAQYNIEYRVFTTSEDSCDQDLINTDYLAIERLLRIIIPMIDQERQERIEADQDLQDQIDEIDEKVDTFSAETVSAITELNDEVSALTDALQAEVDRATAAEEALDGKIDAETERAEAAEELLAEALSAETSAREAADEALDHKIDEEIERAKGAEDELNDKIDAEIARAISAETEIDGSLLDPNKDYVMSASTESTYNLILESKDGNEDHFIKIKFDGDFGEI